VGTDAVRPVCPVAAVFILFPGCNSAPPPTSGGGVEAGAALGAPCVASCDCTTGALCGFPIADGCDAHGVCVAEDVTCNSDGPVVCACDGTPVGLACIYGAGYAPAPVPGTTPGCGPPEGGLGMDGGDDSDAGGGNDGAERRSGDAIIEPESSAGGV
jgi:hypothetical protein